MKHSVIVLSLSVLVSVSAYGSTGGRDSLFLNGEWKTALGNCVLPGTTDENRLGEPNRDTSLTSGLTRLYPYEGLVTYSRTLEVPRGFSGKELFLVLERTKPCTVSVDGKVVGHHDHLLTPQEFRLPGLRPGLHEISLAVDNSSALFPAEVRSSHAWNESTQTNWNGVIGKMFIEARDPLHIVSMKIYPDVGAGNALVRLEIMSPKNSEALLRLSATAAPGEDAGAGKSIGRRPGKDIVLERTARLEKGMNEVSLTVDMGGDFLLWSEFHPHLYRFEATVSSGKYSDTVAEYAGMREFSADGTSFVNNGLKVFLRGKHDACVFPLTGYPPMDTESWRKVFSTAKSYGINHYRFHSWTPPEAAFEAADREGIYLQVELPLWGEVSRKNGELNVFLMDEAERILEEYGNHPSFVMFSLGNELRGDTSLMREWVDELRADDGRHLYCFGSNNNLGWEGPQEGEDFFVACRVGWGEGYSSHVRTTFAFADAEKGGIQNNTRPGTRGNYSGAISASSIPVISHENCQFQVYPDYSEIGKYTGVLYPYNFENFRRKLCDAGLGGMDGRFSQATGRFAVECFKADLEYAFRTPGFGGFQMLDLQDYPGQGTALVGILDAFMESKGLVSPEEFREFCSPVVLLAEFDDYCISAGDTLRADFLISNYSESDWTEPLEWRVSVSDVRSLSGEAADCVPSMSGSCEVCVRQGMVSPVCSLSIPVAGFSDKLPSDAAFCLDLSLSSGDRSNSWRIRVYPDNGDSAVMPASDMVYGMTSGEIPGACGDSVRVAVRTVADGELRSLLEQGFRVVLVPEHRSVEGSTVGGLFTPDYWNWSMFKRVSEKAGKEISPGTLSVYNDPGHPLFDGFPNEGRSSWQWWNICRNSRPLVMDSLSGYLPVLQVIDNVERGHKLGIMAEFSVGNGSLLVCMTDLKAVADTPEGAAFAASVMHYAASEDFSPSYRLEWDELLQLLYGDREESDIQGVENQTDYSAF